MTKQEYRYLTLDIHSAELMLNSAPTDRVRGMVMAELFAMFDRLECLADRVANIEGMSDK